MNKKEEEMTETKLMTLRVLLKFSLVFRLELSRVPRVGAFSKAMSATTL